MTCTVAALDVNNTVPYRGEEPRCIGRDCVQFAKVNTLSLNPHSLCSPLEMCQRLTSASSNAQMQHNARKPCWYIIWYGTECYHNIMHSRIPVVGMRTLWFCDAVSSPDMWWAKTYYLQVCIVHFSSVLAALSVSCSQSPQPSGNVWDLSALYIVNI